MATRIKLLICDEDPNSRVSTRKTVLRVDQEVAGEIGYGIQAVSYALQCRPDVILIAAEEPVQRPLETAEALTNALPDTPIIVYSSNNSPEAVRRAMVLGMSDYIAKPIRAVDLQGSINTVVSREQRRKQRRSGPAVGPQGRGTVITVTGSKGGIGKTIISVNLALALRHETGASVALFDANTQSGDVATMLDLSPIRTVADAIRNPDRLDRHSINELLTEHSSGIQVLAAPFDLELWAGGTSEGVNRIIDLLAQNYDFVIIDTAPSFDLFVRACVEASTMVLVITGGLVSSILSTVAGIHRLEEWEIAPDRIKILLNRSVPVDGLRAEDIKHAVNREIFWETPYDRRIPSSVQLGQPVVLLYDKSPAARSLQSLARSIAGTKTSLLGRTQRSFLEKLFRRGDNHEANGAVPDVLGGEWSAELPASTVRS